MFVVLLTCFLLLMHLSMVSALSFVAFVVFELHLSHLSVMIFMELNGFIIITVKSKELFIDMS